jgi:type I restriction enzyme S subunit
VTGDRIRLRFVAPLRPKSPPGALTGDIAFLPMEAIGEDGAYDHESVRPAADVADSGYTYFEQGDVVRARVTPCFENGKGALLSTLASGRGLGTTELFVFKPSRDIDARFLYYLTVSQEFTEEGAATLYGAHGVRRVDDQFARDYRIRVPPVSTQHAIADYLDRETARIDALIAAKQKMAARLEERWIAFRDEHVLRRCDPLSGTGVVPPSWQMRNLGATVTLHRGHDLPSDSRIPGDVPVVSSGGISGWHNRAVCQPPGVVTGRYGTIGGTHYIDVPYWPLNTTLFVSDFRGSDPRWVYHMLAALPLSIDAEKSAVTGINRNAVGTLKVPVPPCREQQEIARAINEVRRENQAIENVIQTQLTLLQERRRALISAAVTGQLDIAEAA